LHVGNLLTCDSRPACPQKNCCKRIEAGVIKVAYALLFFYTSHASLFQWLHLSSPLTAGPAGTRF
jgi:hypothetical protein